MANNFDRKDARANDMTFASYESGGVHVPRVSGALENAETHIGQIGGHIAIVSATLTRPADTVAYAAGDLIANSTTAGSVVPMTLAVARVNDRSLMVRRVRLKKSTTALTNAQFRIHLYKQSPVASNGDNGVLLTDDKNYVGSLDVTMDRQFTDAAKGFGVPLVGSEISTTPDTGSLNIYALIEARAAYTPGSAEVFTVTLEVHQD